jgi:hypothetical protein
MASFFIIETFRGAMKVHLDQNVLTGDLNSKGE